MQQDHNCDLLFVSSKPLPSLKGLPILEGPPYIEGPSRAKISQKRPIGVGGIFRENSAICETIIEGPGPFILGRGLLVDLLRFANHCYFSLCVHQQQYNRWRRIGWRLFLLLSVFSIDSLFGLVSLLCLVALSTLVRW